VTCMSTPKYSAVPGSAVLALVATVAIGSTLGNTLDPNTLASEIQTRGAKAVASKLSSQQWVDVVKGVETGTRPWLQVAKALHQVTDAGYSESLSLAAGVALARAPRDVLLITAQEFSIEALCGYPDMTDARTNTQAKVVGYLDARIVAVSELSNADVADLRTQCLDVLNKTKHDATRPDNPFSHTR